MLAHEDTSITPETDEVLSRASVCLTEQYYEAMNDEKGEYSKREAFVLASESCSVEAFAFLRASDRCVAIGSFTLGKFAEILQGAIKEHYSFALDQRIRKPIDAECIRVITVYDASKLFVYDWRPPISPYPATLFLRAGDSFSFLYALFTLPSRIIPQGPEGALIRDFQMRASMAFAREKANTSPRHIEDFLYEEFHGDEVYPFLGQLDIDAAVRTACALTLGTVN